MFDVSDREKLEEWLVRQPREAVQLLAVRAALRVLPLIKMKDGIGYSSNSRFRQNVLLPILRASAILATSINGRLNLEYIVKSLVLSNFADARVPLRGRETLEIVASAIEEALLSSFVNENAFAEHAISAIRSAFYASGTDGTLEFDIETLLGGPKIELIRPDDEQAVERLQVQPLWGFQKPPEVVGEAWLALSLELRQAGNDWDIWVDWYQHLLDWGAEDFDYLFAFADWPDDDWAKGPAHINPLIKERLASLASPSPIRPPPKADYFISYATPDESFAREVADVIEYLGKTSIVQFRDFGPGSNFVERMNRGLEAERVIALYSPAYFASEHCQAEWSSAYSSDPKGTKRRLVPFLLQSTELDPLARQVVFKSLLGLDADRRRTAIIEALTYEPVTRSKAVLRQDLAEKASPYVQLIGGRIDATANAIFDKPVSSFDLAELPAMQRAVVENLRRSIPKNTPPIIRSSLEIYFDQLERGASQIIVGILVQSASPIFKEAQGAEAGLWSVGLADVLHSFQENHDKLITHYPLREDRERIFSETPVDEDRAFGKALTEPASAVAKAAEAVEKAGLATPDYAKTAAQIAQTAKDVDLPPPPEPPRDDVVTPKRRHILTSIGFYERTYNLIGTTASLMATNAGTALYDALGRAIEALLRFVRQG
jgi:hypothetical protein